MFALLVKRVVAVNITLAMLEAAQDMVNCRYIDAFERLRNVPANTTTAVDCIRQFRRAELYELGRALSEKAA